MTSDEQRAAALETFTEYFVKNYPGPNTIISDPKWHAPKIFRAAEYALKAAQQAPQTRAVTKFQARRQFEDWMWHNGQVGQGEAWSPEQIATVAKYVLALAANPQIASEPTEAE